MESEMGAFYDWNELISSAVVPVVIISACGLLCLAFYNRLAFVVGRLRSLQRERLSEYKALYQLEEEGEKAALRRSETEQYLHFLEEQTVSVMKRAQYLRNTLFSLIASIFSLALTSLFIGLAQIVSFLSFFVLFFFVTGLLLMLFGLGFAVAEIRISLSPIRMESAFVQRLIKNTLK